MECDLLMILPSNKSLYCISPVHRPQNWNSNCESVQRTGDCGYDRATVQANNIRTCSCLCSSHISTGTIVYPQSCSVYSTRTCSCLCSTHYSTGTIVYPQSCSVYSTRTCSCLCSTHYSTGTIVYPQSCISYCGRQTFVLLGGNADLPPRKFVHLQD
jgi:hypothetical protein